MSTNSVTFTLPASVASDIPVLTQRLLDRMHELLERNTEGQISPTEREQLETLVQMAQFAQLVASAVHKAAP